MTLRELISALECRMEDPTAKGLARAVTLAIREGALTPGIRMPPVRELAHQLAMSPTTVSSAWSVLTRAGTLVTAGRRGTSVARVRAPGGGRYGQALDHQAAFETDLSTGVPDPLLLPDLRTALRELRSAGTPDSYLDNPVLPELRDHLSASWPYEPPALTVTDGAMAALELVIRSHLSFGDRVLVENPTFPPLLDLLDYSGLVVDGVSIDDQGLVPTELAAALEKPVQAVFLQPRAHNPTGMSMSQARFAEIAALLSRTPAILVENDSASAISSSIDQTFGHVFPDRTVHIRSYSKSHGPDLRLAAMSGPEALVAGVQHLRQLGQGWSSRLLQRVFANLLQDPGAQEAVRQAREEYARRRTVLTDALAGAEIHTLGSEGLNVWVPVHDEAAAVMRLALHGVAVAPGGPFMLGRAAGPHIRVTSGLMHTDAEQVSGLIATAARTSPRLLSSR